MKLLILGLGNEILSDDGIGIIIAKEIAKRNKNIDVKYASFAGLSLLDLIFGYEKVILIDAIQTGEKIGTIYRLTEKNLEKTIHYASPHDINLATAIEIGKTFFPEDTPKEFIIFAIEVKEIHEFSEKITPELEREIPKIIKMIEKEIHNHQNG